MAKRKENITKGKIIKAAWELFYENGYEDTTIEEIIELSETSKGSFYHYFKGKDALLSSLSYLFDERYEELMEEMPDDMNCFDKLMYINADAFKMVENRISLDLLARLYSSQLITRGEKHLLDHNRTYFKILRTLISKGQEKGEIRNDFSVNEIVKAYALCERALLYDWCLCNGEYSLYEYATKMMPMFMGEYKVKK